jgi:hypothetical protein
MDAHHARGGLSSGQLVHGYLYRLAIFGHSHCHIESIIPFALMIHNLAPSSRTVPERPRDAAWSAAEHP